MGTLLSHQLLWFFANIYLDPGFEPLISQCWVPRFYSLGHHVGVIYGVNIKSISSSGKETVVVFRDFWIQTFSTKPLSLQTAGRLNVWLRIFSILFLYHRNLCFLCLDRLSYLEFQGGVLCMLERENVKQFQHNQTQQNADILYSLTACYRTVRSMMPGLVVIFYETFFSELYAAIASQNAWLSSCITKSSHDFLIV